jgi:hypothetical protein
MTNCFTTKCPNCRDEDHIDIHAAMWVRLTHDGTDADISSCGDQVWCPRSAARCAACGHTATVADFTPDAATPDTAMKLVVTEQTDTCIILAVDHRGRHWEIDVRADFDEDGGISADINRDGVLCTSAEFGWRDKHDNEKQD